MTMMNLMPARRKLNTVSKGRGAASSSLPRGKENLATAKDKPKARYLYYLEVQLTSDCM